MNNLFIINYNNIIFNQIRLKIIQKKLYPRIFLKKIITKIFFFKIDSFKNISFLESFYFFKILTNYRSYISYFKKKYKEYDLILTIVLKKKNTFFLVFLWMLFFFPLLKKRNIILPFNFNRGHDIVFTNNLYNIYPFFPNIYFSWLKKINYILLFSSSNKKINLLISYYYNILRK